MPLPDVPIELSDLQSCVLENKNWTGGSLSSELMGAFFFYLYSTITQSLPLLPKTSGEYISSALAGGTINVPGMVARAI
jgi:hypothetical protein